MITELTAHALDVASLTALAADHTDAVHVTAHHVTVLAEGGQISVDPIAPPGASKLLRILGWMRWILTGAGIAGLMVAGAIFAWDRWDHGQVRAPKLIAGGVIGAIVIAIAPQIVYASMA